ncbi:hypothetical protein FHT08_003708 [Xanthomonas campestris]|nr:hypothetical protein [Xanthomonas sp. CFBP 8151]
MHRHEMDVATLKTACGRTGKNAVLPDSGKRTRFAAKPVADSRRWMKRVTARCPELLSVLTERRGIVVRRTNAIASTRLDQALLCRACRTHGTIQFAVADGLGQMPGGNGCTVVEIGNGAGHAQDAMHRARGQLQVFDGAFQQHLITALQATVVIGLSLIQLCIGCTGTRELPVACGDYARTHADAVFADFTAAQGLRGQSRYFDMQIDPVQQRAGDAAAIAADAVAAAAATPAAIAGPSARAWVHGSNQLKACWEIQAARCARDRHQARLQGLAQHFQGLPLPLWELVQEQYAVVGQRDLAGARMRTSVNFS